MQNTLEYTAYNGMKFYIVYIETLEKEARRRFSHDVYFVYYAS